MIVVVDRIEDGGAVVVELPDGTPLDVAAEDIGFPVERGDRLVVRFERAEPAGGS